jgi:purine-binding chemotaxis protein CheW
VRNVLVFALGEERRALELRWVREIFTLVALTPVPTAPPALLGVVNFKGAIVPVLDLRVLLGSAAPARAVQPGDALLLVDVDGTRVALAVDRIDAVTAVTDDDDDDGPPLPLADPTALVAAARLHIEGASAPLSK